MPAGFAIIFGIFSKQKCFQFTYGIDEPMPLLHVGPFDAHIYNIPIEIVFVYAEFIA